MKLFIYLFVAFYIFCGIQCARADKDAQSSYEFCKTIRDDQEIGTDLWYEMNSIMEQSFKVSKEDTICNWNLYDSLMYIAPYEHLLYE